MVHCNVAEGSLLNRISRGSVLWGHLTRAGGPFHCRKIKKRKVSTLVLVSGSSPPHGESFSNRWVVRRQGERSSRRLRNFGNGYTCPLARCCSCNFVASPRRLRCATLPWKTGRWGCVAAPNCYPAALVMQKGSSGGSALVCSGDLYANRSPPLPLLTARPRCRGIARAVEHFCCRFLSWVRAIPIPGRRTSGQI